LVHHIKQDKWVPCGGHIEENETFAQALIREFKEEVGLDIEVIDFCPDSVFPDQGIWKTQPKPFHIDTEDMVDTKYDHDLFVEFFFVRLSGENGNLVNEVEEVEESRWFSLKDLDHLDTYPQVIALSKYALLNHPDSTVTN